MSRTGSFRAMGIGLAWVNATLAFGLELAALALLGWGGWLLGGPVAVRVLLGVGLPAVAAGQWGVLPGPPPVPRTEGGRLPQVGVGLGPAAGLPREAAAPAR